MYVSELSFLPVPGFIAHSFHGFVDKKHILSILREHQFHKIVTYQAFFPACIFSFGHNNTNCVTGIYKDTVTVFFAANAAGIFS